MNQYAWKTSQTAAGYTAYIRRVDRSQYQPVKGKDGEPEIWATEIEAANAAMALLLSFINTDMRRCGDVLQAHKSAADRLFPKSIRQRGKSKLVPVERR